MRILITGAGGKLGKRLVVALGAGHDVIPFSRSDLDVTSLPACLAAVERSTPEVVINAAAYTAVDRAEDEPDQAYLGNAVAVRNLATATERAGARFFHFSTDFVFDGDRVDSPYRETDPTNPLSVYGKSKLAGEREALSISSNAVVLRLAWVYGTGGWNFTDWAVNEAREGRQIRVVTDQFGCPTWVGDVARQVDHLLAAEARGLYHCVNRESCTRFDWAEAAIEAAGADPSVLVPITSEVLQQRAPRPIYSVLDNFYLRSQGLEVMRTWREALEEHLSEQEAPLS